MNVNRPATIKTGGCTISNSYCENLIGVILDSQFEYNNHLETIIKKANEKVHVLAKIIPYTFFFDQTTVSLSEPQFS